MRSVDVFDDVGLGLKLPVAPDGRPLRENVTALVKPPNLAAMTV
jgi:hypothetical protein